MQTRSENTVIPETLNTAVIIVTVPITWGLLWAASHGSTVTVLFAAWMFSLFNNTMFSMTHEAVHGVLYKNRRLNRLAGIFCSAFFPTSFTLQRISHLGHHKRNRTDREMYDYYLPTESKWLRNVWIYAGNLFGFYYVTVILGNMIYLVAPWLYTSQWFIKGPARYLGFEPYVEEIAQHSKTQIWLECALSFGYQCCVFYFLDLNLAGWIICHFAFALHWSALQYVVHAWSPRDIIHGAWNLRVSPLFRVIALNYHYHLAHHENPEVPWKYLGDYIDHQARRPYFWEIYLSLWGGARPAPPMEPAEQQA